jgi:hypothetical protein
MHASNKIEPELEPANGFGLDLVFVHTAISEKPRTNGCAAPASGLRRYNCMIFFFFLPILTAFAHS